MDKKILKGIIEEKMEVIREQFSIIRAYEGKIPAIELDLVMANIRDLYELVMNLQVENISNALPKAETVIITPKQEQDYRPEVKEEPVATPRFSSGIISMEPVIEKPAEPEPPAMPEQTYEEPEEPSLPPEINSEPDIPEVQAEPEPEPEHVPANEPPRLQEQPQKMTFDLFTDSTGTTLADRYLDNQEKRIADKFEEKKVIDLRTTIGINDKFLFINELFDGNMRIYDEIIQKLNTAVTMAQADLLMLDLKIAYNWDSESPTVKKFVELIRKKF